MFRRITRRTFSRLLGRSVAVAPIAGVARAGLTVGASIDDAQATTVWPSPGDWGDLYWGTNYAKLLKIKREVDPTGLFTGHHLVGSEAQS